MSKPTYTCEHCCQPFTPRPQNVGRQKYCSRTACRRKGKHERQNRWHRERYADDPAFRSAAKERVQRQRLREIAPHASDGVVPPLSAKRLERMTHAVLGLALQLGGDDDPAGATALVDAWADRGSRLGGRMASGP